ncbi:MAG: hypothetical protein GQ570_10720 [Helicobacteraceae bacterium]|nr:hypothetical protein [Helicobacteraceae bacterium]
MEDQTTLERLGSKVSEILQQFNSLKGENEMLRTEITTLRAESEAKNSEIERLDELNQMKDLEIEEIVTKIETIFN